MALGPGPSPPRVVRTDAAFPARVRDGRWLVSMQHVSNAPTPEGAVQEMVDTLARGRFPQVSVVNFGDGFRWTYEVKS